MTQKNSSCIDTLRDAYNDLRFPFFLLEAVSFISRLFSFGLMTLVPFTIYWVDIFRCFAWVWCFVYVYV